ncbi:MAG TPA: hypothetical protein VEJ39_02490, partial [Candidatus Acidoferrales bacterium]|nr:hypothetical protein [Candidatus Acidoferrales bacterium]
MTNKLTHQEMRGVLPAGCRKGKEWETTCPLCGHGHLRLFGDDGIKCMNGCATGDVIAWIRNALKLEPGKRSAHPAVKSTKKAEPSDGISLTQYCQMKGLSELALRVFYSSTAAGTDLERKVNGKPAVAWPYMDATGNVLAYKVRKSRNSHDTFFDPKDPHIPYGLWLSQNGEQPKDLVLCEGESDQQTSTLYNIPALGIPGSQGWRTEYARLPVIKNAERIFVALDSDEDGTKFADKIAKDVHIYRLVFPTKDVNELHVTSPMDEEKTIDG